MVPAVPEPETHLMLVVGIGVVSWVVRKRPRRENLWAISPLQSRFGDCVEKLVQLAARRVERVLFGLGESWPDERAAVFLDHFGDGFIHRHLLELSVIVAPPDELAAQQP